MKPDTASLEQTINEIVAKISSVVPEDLQRMKQDLEKNVRATAESAFQKLNLVTREEFDVQRVLLSKSQQRMKQLEQRIGQLEEVIKDVQKT